MVFLGECSRSGGFEWFLTKNTLRALGVKCGISRCPLNLSKNLDLKRFIFKSYVQTKHNRKYQENRHFDV